MLDRNRHGWADCSEIERGLMNGLRMIAGPLLTPDVSVWYSCEGDGIDWRLRHGLHAERGFVRSGNGAKFALVESVKAAQYRLEGTVWDEAWEAATSPFMLSR